MKGKFAKETKENKARRNLFNVIDNFNVLEITLNLENNFVQKKVSTKKIGSTISST